MKRTIWMLGLWAWTVPASAQTVRGVVVEKESAAPVEGAMVVLLRNDKPVYSVLTDAAGRFVVRADRSGPHALKVDRIGYASTRTAPFVLPADTSFHRIAVPVEAIELQGLDVESGRRCEVRPEEGRVTARVWEEARKALAVAAWTQERQVYRYTLLKFTRELDTDGRTVKKEDRRFQRGYARSPFTSLPAERLIRDGFVQEDAGGGSIYYAPDAEAFLSDAFLDTHCMRVRSGREPNLLGLEFQPVRQRHIPEIQGVLWLDARTARLVRLEYRYRNLSIPEAEDAGGRVTFGALPNGTWIVREWSIRMPRLARVVNADRIVTVGYREQGGVVWRVTDNTGRLVVEAESASIGGSVLDTLGTGPAPGATVRVRGTESTATTDSTGRFLLTNLTDGVYTVDAITPDLEAWGVTPASTNVETALGEVAAAQLRLPSVADRAQEWCGEVARAGLTSVVLGRVTRPSGEPVPGATVRAVWKPGTIPFDPGRPVTTEAPGQAWSSWHLGRTAGIETHADPKGIFLLCAVPADQILALDASESLREPVRIRLSVRKGADVRSVVLILPRSIAVRISPWTTPTSTGRTPGS